MKRVPFWFKGGLVREPLPLKKGNRGSLRVLADVGVYEMLGCLIGALVIRGSYYLGSP